MPELLRRTIGNGGRVTEWYGDAATARKAVLRPSRKGKIKVMGGWTKPLVPDGPTKLYHATRKKSAAQLNREIAEALRKSGKSDHSHATRTLVRRIFIGNGLKDGIGTAAAGYRLRKLRETGATDISLASTGRLTFTRNGQRYEYRVTLPRDRREADAFEAAGTVDSPLSRALADITAGNI